MNTPLDPDKFSLDSQSQVMEFLKLFIGVHKEGFTQEDYEKKILAYRAALGFYALRLVRPDMIDHLDMRVVSDVAMAMDILVDSPDATRGRCPIGFTLAEMENVYQQCIKEISND
jgi:hypothetical protein